MDRRSPSDGRGAGPPKPGWQVRLLHGELFCPGRGNAALGLRSPVVKVRLLRDNPNSEYDLAAKELVTCCRALACLLRVAHDLHHTPRGTSAVPVTCSHPS